MLVYRQSELRCFDSHLSMNLSLTNLALHRTLQRELELEKGQTAVYASILAKHGLL